ncbi:MAG TPA: hypothetical protein VGF94_26355 [Kofleriaceae bacterium]
MSRLALLVVFAPALALANPKVAVEPLDGDNDGAIVAIVTAQAEHHAKVTSPKVTSKTADELNLSDLETPKALKKLRIRLGVDMIIHGKVDRSDGKKRLILTVSGRKKSSTFEVPYKLATSKKFHDKLDEELAKRIDPDAEREAQEADEDDQAERDKREHDRADRDRADRDRADKDRADKARADDDRRRRDKQHAGKVRTAARETDEDDGEEVTASDDHHKRRHHHHLEERDLVTQSAVWADAGAAGLHRTLKYESASGGTPPPPVGTGSVSGLIEGEVYPWSFDDLHASGLAGLGLFGSFAKTVGLGIKVPGTTSSAAIDEGSYQLGARYRFVFGASSIAIGASYWNRHFIADQSSLPTGTTLDMPDVKYTAFAPGAIARLAATPTIAVMLAVDVPLVLDAGAITSQADLRQASLVAFAVQGGADFALAKNYGLRLAALFDQVGFKFSQPQRGVTAATDRTMGAFASFALMY